jgi:hypothetical protein
MMKERPILFSTEMVRALLDDRKTQTRRVIKPQPVSLPGFWNKLHYASESHWIKGALLNCLYGVAGDRLWVRETWRRNEWSGRISTKDGGIKETGLVNIEYRAGGNLFKTPIGKTPEPSDKWRPSIFMPRWASRITLEITDVRVERVQDITEADAVSEGLERREHFIRLWDKLNEKRGYSFDSNPWVWVIEFKRVK